MNPSNSSKPARLSRYLGALVLGALLAGSACAGSQGQDITGETHFLTLCQPEADSCGAGLSCLCGVCTRACNANGDCSAFPSSQCVDSTAGMGACGESAPSALCDVGCRSDADCTGLSSSHRCESGVCRAGEAGVPPGDCMRAGLEGNQVVVLGDTFMALTHQVTAGVEELARASGALPAGQRYRDVSSSFENALAWNGNGIAAQYARALAESSPSVVIMNGGGADALNGSCDTPPDASCPALTAAADAARELFTSMATGGVTDIVYAFYPDPQTATVRAKMDVLRPLIRAACESSPVPCHWVDLRPTFEGRYAEYITPDGLNPTAEGALAAAVAIWDAMRTNCVAQ